MELVHQIRPKLSRLGSSAMTAVLVAFVPITLVAWLIWLGAIAYGAYRLVRMAFW